MPDVRLALRLVHQQFKARQGPGVAQAVELQGLIIGCAIGIGGKAQGRQADQPQARARHFLDTRLNEALDEVARGIRALVHVAAHQQWPAHGLADDLRRVGQAGRAQHVLEQQVGRVAALEGLTGGQLYQQQATAGTQQLQRETRWRDRRGTRRWGCFLGLHRLGRCRFWRSARARNLDFRAFAGASLRGSRGLGGLRGWPDIRHNVFDGRLRQQQFGP
ncbi:hypothetical protein D3C81_1553270 [compost metagenome]